MFVRQVIQEVFCWTRNFTEVRRLARRKEEVYKQLLGNQQPMLALGLQGLLTSLRNSQVSFASGRRCSRHSYCSCGRGAAALSCHCLPLM